MTEIEQSKIEVAVRQPSAQEIHRDVVFSVEGLDFHYGGFKALEGVTMDIRQNEITALIGPSAAASRRSCAASTG